MTYWERILDVYHNETDKEMSVADRWRRAYLIMQLTGWDRWPLGLGREVEQ